MPLRVGSFEIGSLEEDDRRAARRASMRSLRDVLIMHLPRRLIPSLAGYPA
jgi:hypothetical protein